MEVKHCNRKKPNLTLTKFITLLEPILKKRMIIAKDSCFRRIKDRYHINKDEKLQNHLEKTMYLKFQLFRHKSRKARNVKARYFAVWHRKLSPIKHLIESTTLICESLVLKMRSIFCMLKANKDAFGSYLQYKKRLALRLRRLQEKNRTAVYFSSDHNRMVAMLVVRLKVFISKKIIVLKEMAFTAIFQKSIDNEDSDIEDLYISYKLLKKEKVSLLARSVQAKCQKHPAATQQVRIQPVVFG